MDKKIIRKFYPFVKPYRAHLILVIILGAIVASVQPGALKFTKEFVDNILSKKDLSHLKVIPFVIIGLFAVGGVARYWCSFLTKYISEQVIYQIRNKLFDHYMRLSMNYFAEQATGVMMSRITYDVQVLQTGLTRLSQAVKEPLLLVGLLGIAFYHNWHLTLIALIAGPIIAIIISKVGSFCRRYSRQGQMLMGELSALLQETFQGIKIIKSFQLEDKIQKRFQEKNLRFRNTIIKSARFEYASSPTIEFICACAASILIVLGGQQVILGQMTLGEFILVLGSLGLLLAPIKSLNNVNIDLQRALSAGERILSVMEIKPLVTEKMGARILPTLSQAIAFDHVSFSYPAEDEERPRTVLENVSFTVPKGKVVAIIGASGAGKTTLIGLLFRFYDATKGTIKIDGVDIRDATLGSLVKQIALVNQDLFLFNDTILNNISYGCRESMDSKKIEEAARMANAHEFIATLPQGYQTVIGDRGIKLSGGQCQRIAIARAILKDAPLLILDEATSNLDSQSEQAVKNALENLIVGRTTLIIAHRLSTIANANKIIVLHEGRVAESGSHEELLGGRGAYYHFYRLQQTGEV